MDNKEKIALITDSCADLHTADIEKYDITVIPLRIICGDGEYLDGVNINGREIYKRLENGELPKTSQPCSGDVIDAINRTAEKGYRKIMLSSGLSGTYSVMDIFAKERTDLDIRVFDSRSGALGLGMIILQLAEDICGGMSWKELTEKRVQYLIDHTYPFFSLDTLEYLQKGGRIGKVTAAAGMLLGIKPIITFADDGQLCSVMKVRGNKQLKEKLIEVVHSSKKAEHRYNIAVEHGGAPEEMEILRKMMISEFPHYSHIWDGEIDGVLSTYIGKGVLGAAIQTLY